jgi:S1-C subfamily serine protease
MVVAAVVVVVSTLDVWAQDIPDISTFDLTTRQSLELACIGAKTEGPAAYARCLNEQISALQASPAVPDISRFDRATRQSIEMACIGAKMKGPAAYAGCLNAQIGSMGLQSSEHARPSTPEAPHLAPGSPPPRPDSTSTRPGAPIASPSASLSEPAAGFTWAGVQKPPMPSTTRSGNIPPDALFRLVEKSVYVVLSAPSEQKLRARSNVSQGAAVAVTPRLALTNCHVLGSNRVHFLLKRKAILAATIAYGDKSSDRCVLEIKKGALAAVGGIRPYSNLTVGERVYTVGSPSGLENTLGEGIISGLRRRWGVDLVQTSAPISPGSSGGGLFDAAGNLIGITTFLLRDAQNLNFAIAADAYWR